jgi:hypothetical protein
MNKNLVFRNIVFLLTIFIIIGLFIEVKDPFGKGIFDLIFEIVVLLTYTFAFLWIKRRILFIGFILSIFSFNFSILLNPLIQIENHSILIIQSYLIGMIINGLALLCLLLGIWKKLNISFLIKEIKFGILTIFTLIVIVTGLFQLIARI